jgi:hypothetical protein
MFKIIAFFVIVLYAWLYVSAGILLTMEGTCMITVEPIPKSNIKIIEKGKIKTPNILIHDCLLSWLITVPSMKLEVLS